MTDVIIAVALLIVHVDLFFIWLELRVIRKANELKAAGGE